MIMRAEATPKVVAFDFDSSAGNFMTKMISINKRGTVNNQSMYRYASLKGEVVAKTVPSGCHSYASTQELKIRI
eukprot:CAMPEP_0170949880 /NCGR_PEP_ID=MMETSP0735-20130129/29567_1 /TAXON_ID=186038 /ORGANISM="Fragilariopsis kerguelensis, Strain L26-C5" /LENGTH=73 /DNA_ID=CAMNT_0011360085 /DNA_START=437 /DNA_END=658 /DNA_ORIENTATION=+